MPVEESEAYANASNFLQRRWEDPYSVSSIDLVLDCMGSIRSIHLYGKRYRRIVFTIEYEGVIIIYIGVLRREIARRLAPNHFQS